MAKEILLDIEDNIATVTFNRPDQHNAISYEGWQLLSKTVRDIGQEGSVKVTDRFPQVLTSKILNRIDMTPILPRFILRHSMEL